MWQAETWDPKTIDQELKWAADLGFNAMRVFLHDLAWSQDPEGFLDRVDRFLEIADSHGHRTLLVIWDGVWDPLPVAGPQTPPVPGVHNSRWLQSPGAKILGDDAATNGLKPYVDAVVSRFREDPRVLGWDLFNEADNPNAIAYVDTELDADEKTARAFALLRRTTTWVRAWNPIQPLTTGVYTNRNWREGEDLEPIVEFMLHESDVISFHSYRGPAEVRELLGDLKLQNRPIWCTEYMGRPGSTFREILPVFAENKHGAFNWGFVSGRTQTIYPWTTWLTPGESEPDPWFHDVLRADGTAFDPEEAIFLREITAGK